MSKVFFNRSLFGKLPFNRAIFWKTFVVVMALVVLTFAILFRFTGYRLTNADLYGSLISALILSYLVHLWLLPAEYADERAEEEQAAEEEEAAEPEEGADAGGAEGQAKEEEGDDKNLDEGEEETPAQ